MMTHYQTPNVQNKASVEREKRTNEPARYTKAGMIRRYAVGALVFFLVGLELTDGFDDGALDGLDEGRGVLTSLYIKIYNETIKITAEIEVTPIPITD